LRERPLNIAHLGQDQLGSYLGRSWMANIDPEQTFAPDFRTSQPLEFARLDSDTYPLLLSLIWSLADGGVSTTRYDPVDHMVE
jgi:hypothetical protein